MKARLYLVLLLCSSHLSCASYIRVHDSPSLTYEALNKKLSERKVDITLVNDQIFSGIDVKVAEDSTSWRDIHTNSLVRMSTDSIHQVTIYKRRTVQGILFGLISVFIISAVIGYSGGQDCERDEEDCIDKESTALIMGVLLTLPGLLIGTIAGAATKRPNHFILQETDEKKDSRREGVLDKYKQK